MREKVFKTTKSIWISVEPKVPTSPGLDLDRPSFFRHSHQGPLSQPTVTFLERESVLFNLAILLLYSQALTLLVKASPVGAAGIQAGSLEPMDCPLALSLSKFQMCAK